MFIIVNLETNEPVLDEYGVRLVFIDGGLANVSAKYLTVSKGVKHIPQRLANDNWKERERLRFENGEYITPNWSVSRCFLDYGFSIPENHFLHVSKKDPSKIAFTQNNEKGIADIQTPMRVGAYLLQFVEGMTQELANSLALSHASLYAPSEVCFAKTAKEITKVYLDGPNSCMSKSLSYYCGHIHPVTVYGDSDLVLAYIKNDSDEISARGLVWPDKMVYGRLYGDTYRLDKALKSLGYDNNGGSWDIFEGAKIAKIENENGDGFIMPYLDGIQSVIEKDDYFVISAYGDLRADSTCGTTVSGVTCDNCEDLSDRDEMGEVYVHRTTTRQWCHHCRENDAFFCEGIQEMVSNSRAFEIDGSCFSDWYVAENANRCDYSGDYTFDDLVTVIIDHNGETSEWSENIAESHGFICRISGVYYSDDLAIYDDWTDKPRAMTVSPNDLPGDESFCAIVLKFAA
jgi:hypothetical protein